MKYTILTALVFAAAIAHGQTTLSFTGPVPLPVQSPVDAGRLNYANTNSGAVATVLPWVLTNADWSANTVPSSIDYSNAGWRAIVNIQYSSYGPYAVSGYVIKDFGDGTCQLIATNYIATQTKSLASQITNSAYWTQNFSNNCALFSSVIQSYQGHGAQTNANVNSWTVFSYIATNTAFATVPTNIVNVMLEYSTSQQILAIPGITNTAQFFSVLANIFH